MRGIRLALLVIVSALAVPPAEPQPPRPRSRVEVSSFVVIVHPQNPVTSLTIDEVSRMFLKKTTTWRDGGPVLPVDLPPDSPVRAGFSTAILGRPVAAVKAYWQQQIFSGQHVPPPEGLTERNVLAFVRANSAAIGYVSGETPLAGVKIVGLSE